MEQARGLAGNNIVTVLMRERGIPLQSASDRIGAHFASLMRTFVRAKAALPSFGDAALDAAVARYVAAMEHWVIGNLDWSFCSKRYFGDAVEHVKETLVVTLSPPVRHEDTDDAAPVATVPVGETQGAAAENGKQ